MKKRAAILTVIIIGTIFLIGCERISENRAVSEMASDVNVDCERSNENGADSEITPDVNFDWNNTVSVLHRALGGSRRAAEDSARILSEREIRGAVSAELLEDYFQEETSWHGGTRTTYTIVVMEIVTEDDRVFRLRFGDPRGGHSEGEERWWVISDTRDMQTGWEWSSWEDECFLIFEEEPAPDFDLDRAVRVIQEAVGSDDESVNQQINNSVDMRFRFSDIKGAISAEVIEDTWVPMLMPDDVVVKIETEDGVHVLLHLADGRHIERIWGYESREQIWPVPRS